MPDLVLCDNCGRPAKYRGLKLCARCYQRFAAHGDFDLHTRPAMTCTVAGCEQSVKAYGLCSKHWRRVQAHGQPEDRKWSRRFTDRCAVPGCGGEHRSMGLCERHYTAEQRKGHPIWRTLARQKVHQDRPWTAESVVNIGPVMASFQSRLTSAAGSAQDRNEGASMTEAVAQQCPICREDVVPIECGERTSDGGTCTDLICPECGEEIPQAS